MTVKKWSTYYIFIGYVHIVPESSYQYVHIGIVIVLEYYHNCYIATNLIRLLLLLLLLLLMHEYFMYSLNEQNLDEMHALLTD